MTRTKWKLAKWLIALLLAAALAFLASSNLLVAAIASAATSDKDVQNTASFSTDTVYQIVSDRFFDGDPSNNPSGDIFDPNDPRKYHGGDWAGITGKITDGYLTGMGITAIWISSPVENINSLDPSNNSAAYHGYWAKDFFRTNQYFGSVQDFKTLIDTAHLNGIKVVIDFAPNHTSTAEYGEMAFPEDGRLYRDGQLVSGFKTDTQGIFNHESWTDFSTWENSIYHSMYGLADLNQMNATVDTYLKDSINLWLDMGVDGIRVDAVKHMPMGWQSNWLSSVYSHKPVFVFGEWFHGGTGRDAEMDCFANESGMSVLDFRFTNAVRSALGDLTLGMNDLYNVIVDREVSYKEVNDQVTFVDNHDMSRFMTLANGNARALENAYVLQMTSSGIPTVYYGSEQYATGGSDPYNRGDMPGFDRTSKAYNVISKLAPLRKSNPAIAYGKTTEKWMNNDVLVYERKFGDNVVLTAVNRNTSAGYDISGVATSLPDGAYGDVLQNLLGGGTAVVTNGKIPSYYLGAGQAAVWSYTAPSNSAPVIGNIDPLVGKPFDIVTISGIGFGTAEGQVKFGTQIASVVGWTDSCIQVKVPTMTAGYYTISVTTSSGKTADEYAAYKVLSGTQVAVRFKALNAATAYGQNIYIVGNCLELGNWDVAKAVGPFFNATSTIAQYPNWFFDVSVPAGTAIEYKFIKKDAAGNVVWESGMNHTYTTPASGTGEVSQYFNN